MTFLTYFALIACLFALAIGGLSMLAERGYQFDLRRRSRRKGMDGRQGGRREADRFLVASK